MNRNKWKAQTASIPPTLFFSFWANIRCPFLDLCRNVNRGNELPSLVFKRSTYGWHISTGFANPSYSFSRLTDLNLTLTHFVLGLVSQHCRWVSFFLFHVFTDLILFRMPSANTRTPVYFVVPFLCCSETNSWGQARSIRSANYWEC